MMGGLTVRLAMNSHSTATSGAVIIVSVVTIGNAINF